MSVKLSSNFKGFTQHSSLSAGFTLVESLVAVSLVMLAMTGPLVIAGQSFLAARDAENRLTASYLAQEAVEYVHMLRDTTYLADYFAGVGSLSDTSFWNDFVNNDNTSGGSPGTTRLSILQCEGHPYDGTTYDDETDRGGDGLYAACALDTSLPIGVGLEGSSNALQACAPDIDSCPPLLVSGGRYVLAPNAGTPSIFTREIQFYHFGVGNSQGLEMVVTVSWTFHDWTRTPVTKSVVLTSHIMPWQ